MEPLAWLHLPIRLLEQFSQRIAVHEARLTLMIHRAMTLALADSKKPETKRAIRDLERQARGGGPKAPPARRLRPQSEEGRRAAMAAFGGSLDA